MDNELVFYKLSEREAVLEKRLKEQLSAGFPDIWKETEEKLKEAKGESRLKLAFVGQHNAGKSTIISALTGDRSIKISSNVETDSTSAYEWGDVLLYDTPGLFAGVKTSHDEEAYKAIEESDFIVFCITSSLFDNLLIEDFVNLAYKRAYKNKIILVVNKMSQEDGEFEELVENYRKTLRKTFEEQGGDPDDFPTVFIDAKDYKDGIADGDDELVEISNFAGFVDLLNERISAGGLCAKLVTECNILTDTIARVTALSGSETDRSFLTVLSRLERTIRSYKRDMRYMMLNKESSLRSQIMEIGDELIMIIGAREINDDDTESVNLKIKKATEDAIDDIEKELSKVNRDLVEEIGDVLSTDMALYVFEDINSEKYVADSLSAVGFNNFLQKYGAYEKMVKNGGEAFSRIAFPGGTPESNELALKSGATLSQAIIQMGYYFGKSFKPVELAGSAGKIAKIGKVVGPVMAAVDVALVIADKAIEEGKIREIRDAKKRCFNAISAVASDIIKELEKQYFVMESEVFEAKTAEIAEIKSNIIKESETNEELSKNLKEIDAVLRGLLEETHG